MIQRENRPLVVLFLPRSLRRGGAESTMARLLAMFPTEAVHSVVVAEPPGGGTSAVPIPATVAVHLMPEIRRRPLRWLVEFYRVLGDLDPHVVHTFSPLTGVLARLVIRVHPHRSRIALVHREPSPWYSFHPAIRLANKITFRYNCLAYAVSTEVRSSMTARARRKTSVLVHGINIARHQAEAMTRSRARSFLGVNQDSFLIGSVGSLKAQKDYPTAIAAAALLENMGIDFIWVVLGEGSLGHELRQAVEAAGLGTRFLLPGEVPEAPQLLKAFDLFVGASRSEGMPVALLEAGALNIRCIASDIAAHAEAKALGVAVDLVPVGHVTALATAIEKAYREGDQPLQDVTIHRAYDLSLAVDRLVGDYRKITALNGR